MTDTLVRPVIIDLDAHPFRHPLEVSEIVAMTFPVRCSGCWKVYDAAAVHVTGRYADCSMWKAPCCGQVCDDRQMWGAAPGRCNGFTEISKQPPTIDWQTEPSDEPCSTGQQRP